MARSFPVGSVLLGGTGAFGFAQFLNDRQTRKPSAHTMKAYRQDFLAIATLVTGGKPTC